MKVYQIFVSCFLIFLFGCTNHQQEKKPIENKTSTFAIVIHGGAGTIKKEFMTDEQEKAYLDKLQEALNTGYLLLENGGTSIDAVQKTINILEDSPLFNAGKGAVFNSIGKHELDASIMDGSNLNSGAVAGVTSIKNPINAARIVMDSTRHVLLSGKGAEEFVKQFDIEIVDESYFDTEKRFNQLKKVQGRKAAFVKDIQNNDKTAILIDDHKYGTVGAVAIDKNGNIAAGTSTGGMTNKKFGRIGDSPIIGAGTYANNKSCGVSSTGTGEYFIRTNAAHEVSSLMLHKNLTLKEALKEVIHHQIQDLGGDGGMVALDKNGNIAWDFNTEGMYRGYKKSTGENIIEIYAQK